MIKTTTCRFSSLSKEIIDVEFELVCGPINGSSIHKN
jgi:hypothetical protein